MPIVSSDSLLAQQQILVSQIRSLASGETVVSSPALLAELAKLGIPVVDKAVEKGAEEAIQGQIVDQADSSLQGLALSASLQLFDKTRILSALQDPVRQVLDVFDVHWTIDSTNNDLLQRAGASGFHGAVSLAE